MSRRLVPLHTFLVLILFTFSLLPSAQAQAGRAETKLSPGQHVAKVNGVDFAYFVAGTGPLLIVQAPGWGIGSEYLRNGLAPLESHFTLVFYDTRGSGRSSRPSDATKMSTSEMVDDLEGLRRYWGIPSITVMGHSHGGAIALGYAIRYPKHVRKLILVDSSIQGFEAERERIVSQEFEARKADKRYASAIASQRASSGPGFTTDEEFGAVLNRDLPLYFYDPDANMPLFEKTLSELPSAWAAHSNGAADAKSSFNEGNRDMNRVQAKVLILVGRDDMICPPVIAERIHAAIPHSTLEILDKSGHFPWIEAPHEFFGIVTAFAGK